MNFLFLTISNFNPTKSGIYTDLMDYFVQQGHRVTVVCPLERRDKGVTNLTNLSNINILRVKTPNITGNCSLIEKGLGTICIESLFINAIKKHLSKQNFDCVLYSTPPVTLEKVIKYTKKKYQACSYLLLKDIFPQNAVDLKYFSAKSLFYFIFKKKERQLYSISDHIGCMSLANKDYLLKHESYLKEASVEVNPNSRRVELVKKDEALRKKLNIPLDKTIFIFGGNLGQPQGIDFLLECIKANEQRTNTFFVIVGQGKERNKLEALFANNDIKSSLLLDYMSSQKYSELCAVCDVGLIFLHKNFTIPNFPSRTLSYLQAGIPYIAAVDSVTDIGTIAEENKFGLNCLWGDLKSFNQHVETLAENPNLVKEMGQKAKDYFLNNYTVEHSYQIIMKHFDEREPHV